MGRDVFVGLFILGLSILVLGGCKAPAKIKISYGPDCLLWVPNETVRGKLSSLSNSDVKYIILKGANYNDVMDDRPPQEKYVAVTLRQDVEDLLQLFRGATRRAGQGPNERDSFSGTAAVVFHREDGSSTFINFDQFTTHRKFGAPLSKRLRELATAVPNVYGLNEPAEKVKGREIPIPDFVKRFDALDASGIREIHFAGRAFGSDGILKPDETRARFLVMNQLAQGISESFNSGTSPVSSVKPDSWLTFMGVDGSSQKIAFRASSVIPDHGYALSLALDYFKTWAKPDDSRVKPTSMPKSP
jgi:hypothetical protein